MEELYVKLRDKLNQLSFGYPSTETGEELEILQWFFDPGDAEMYLEMEDRFQTPAEIAAKLGLGPEAVEEKMEAMALKGLLFRLKDQNGLVKYRIMPMVHGIFEANDKRINLDPEFAKKFSNYYGKHMMKYWNSTDTPLFRTIPINSEMVVGSTVLSYDDAAAILKGKKRIALTDCACRGLMESMGKRRCTHPIETCLMFDEVGDYYVQNGLGRYITTDEALEGLKRNEREGLVVNVSNSMDPEIMCSCCSCCCGVNVAAKYFPGPSLQFQSNHICVYDEELCVNCGKCVERCAFGANKLVDGKIIFKADHCYGCGLCVTTCPQKARSLVRKPEDKLYDPPQALYRGYGEMKKYRGM
ncbi:MAG TPA: 4Fe-4S binding protein [Syntrophomonas sp.]|nr:4Fe-4S binding protein [Syntrophomonas sp.]